MASFVILFTVFTFYPIHVLLNLCPETWCFGFSTHFISTIFVADYDSSKNMGNLLTNHFMILNYTIQMMWYLVCSS